VLPRLGPISVALCSEKTTLTLKQRSTPSTS
jgi:hypothetical protein